MSHRATVDKYANISHAPLGLEQPFSFPGIVGKKKMSAQPNRFRFGRQSQFLQACPHHCRLPTGHIQIHCRPCRIVPGSHPPRPHVRSHIRRTVRGENLRMRRGPRGGPMFVAGPGSRKSGKQQAHSQDENRQAVQHVASVHFSGTRRFSSPTMSRRCSNNPCANGVAGTGSPSSARGSRE